MPDDFVIIGIDGGATEVRAHQVYCARIAEADGFSLGTFNAARKYEMLAEFQPLPVTEQLRQRDAGAIDLSAAEREQGTRWTAAAADCVMEIARAAGTQCVLVGMGMPGLKTPDGRGINVINNGPRIADFLDQLEERLRAAGIDLAAPIAALGSDADYCGLGEMYADGGLFRDVDNAYYMGGGTGIADAMKLRGKLVPFDEAKSWIQKSWQMPSYLGPTFEKLVSAKALNETYWALLPPSSFKGEGRGGGSAAPRFPEADALAGSSLASAHLGTAALVLAELLFERLHTIYAGRADAPHRGAAYEQLQKDHPFRGTVLDRIVIGQRIGQIYAGPQAWHEFAASVQSMLAGLIVSSRNLALFEQDLAGKTLRGELFRGSTLRAAPAIGAAVAAVRSLSIHR